MRILFVLPYVPSPIRVRPYNFIRELSKRHEVRVLAVGEKPDSRDASALRGLCREVEVVHVSRASRIEGCARSALGGEPLQAGACRSPDLERRLGDLLDAGVADVVHVEHLRAGYVAPLLEGVPTLFDSVDCISLLLERTLRSSHSLAQRALSRLELTRMRHYEGELISRFDRVTVTSTADAQALGGLAPDAKVSVVTNGVDLEYFAPRTSPEPSTIVFSGKMSYHANVSAVLYFVREIFPLIRTVRPDVRLLIVGSAPPRSVLSLGRDPRIEVTGYLPDIRPALGRASVAVCPVTVKVGIQNKLLEAMSMALPVVTTPQGAEGLAVEEGRDLLVGRSPAEFAAQIFGLLEDRGLRTRISQAGRRYVEANHRWDAAAARIEALYHEARRDHGTGLSADAPDVGWATASDQRSR